jgi:hypothetical protein
MTEELLPTEQSSPEVAPKKKAAPKKKKQDRKKVTINTDSLSTKNRILRCQYFDKDVTVNPDRFSKLVAYWGSEDAAIRNFLSKSAEVVRRDDPLAFTLFSNPTLKESLKYMRELVNTFNQTRQTRDALNMQNGITDICRRSGFNDPSFSLNNGVVVSFTLSGSFPFFGKRSFTITMEDILEID